MLKRIAKIGGALLLLLVLAAGVVRLVISGPIGPLAGGALGGEVVEEPVDDWSFTDDHGTIAVESRPDDPHSVTTVCFVHEGQLYVPAQGGSEKRWPGYVVDDPRVRLGIGDRIYPVNAIRVTDTAQRDAMVASATRKYAQLAEAVADADLDEMDIWLFRIEPR